MKYKKFEVVELNNKNKATILDIKDKCYLAEIVDENGNTLGFKSITDEDISNVIFAKNNNYKIS